MGQAADGQDEETAVLVERPIEQIPKQRVHAVIGAQVGLMEHPGIDLAPEQVLEQDVRFLAELAVGKELNLQVHRISQTTSPTRSCWDRCQRGWRSGA